MFQVFLVLVAFFFNPLGLSWQKVHVKSPKIENHTHYRGTVSSGPVVYLGKNMLDLETELQLYFVNKKMSDALLILGPTGLDDFNCLKKYKLVVNLLNKKYGHFRNQVETRDPLAEDLVTFEYCNSLKIGTVGLQTYWKKADFNITADLLGDDEGFYIHIYYRNTAVPTQERVKKLMKRL